MSLKLILLTHLAIGLTIVVLLMVRKLKRETAVEPSDIFLGKNEGKFGERMITATAVVFAIVFWPVAVYMFLVERKLNKAEQKIQPRAFAIQADDLLRIWTIEQIEEIERVVDPLNAAPAIPFGHLNDGWNRFTQQITEGDILWSFTTRWSDELDAKFQDDGYVIVRNGAPGPYYRTSSRVLSCSE